MQQLGAISAFFVIALLLSLLIYLPITAYLAKEKLNIDFLGKSIGFSVVYSVIYIIIAMIAVSVVGGYLVSGGAYILIALLFVSETSAYISQKVMEAL